MKLTTPRAIALVIVALLMMLCMSINLHAQSTTRLELSWQDNSTNETHWIIQRAISFSGPWTEVQIVESTTQTAATPQPPIVATPEQIVRTNYFDSNLPFATLYYYRVLAMNATGRSAASNITSARTVTGPITNSPVPLPASNAQVRPST